MSPSIKYVENPLENFISKVKEGNIKMTQPLPPSEKNSHNELIWEFYIWRLR